MTTLGEGAEPAMTEPMEQGRLLVLVPLATLQVGQREVVVVDVPDGALPRSWVGRLARLGSRSVRITGVGTFALPDGATFRRCDLMVEDAEVAAPAPAARLQRR